MLWFKKKETFLYEKMDGYSRLLRYGGAEPVITVDAVYEGLPVTEIAENAFYDASRVETVILPECIKTIGTNAFRGCKSLKSLMVPDACEVLGDYAFGGCKALESVSFGKGISEISEGLFSKCTALKEISLPATVKKVGEEAFSGCSELEFIDLGTGVASIGENAFKNCSKKLSVVLPEELQIEDRELLENADMIYRRTKNGLALLKYGGHDTVIEMPDKLGDEYITAIGPGVFANFAYLEKIKLPAKLTFIGEQAFYGCSGLNAIEFPETLVYIGRSAFTACGPRVNRPGYMARKASDFDEDDGLKEITLPASLKTVEDLAFAACSSLRKINFGSGKTSFGAQCFLGCPVESIELPEGITELQTEIFRGCGRLKTVKLPSTLETIWQRAFVDCESIESIELPGKLQIISDGAFLGCTGIKNLVIPANVREIGDEAFAFDSFESLTVAQNSRYFEMISGCLVGKKDGRLITSVLEPGAVLTVPGSASEICSLAFAGSPIEELTVPAHVKKIGQWALKDSAIKKLTVLNPAIELGNGILLDTGDVDIQPDGSPVVDILIGTAEKE